MTDTLTDIPLIRINGTVIGADLDKDRVDDAHASYEFDGNDDRIDINHVGFPMGNSSRTITGWIKRDGNESSFARHVRSLKGDA